MMETLKLIMVVVRKPADSAEYYSLTKLNANHSH
jgi:hypothetical protein